MLGSLDIFTLGVCSILASTAFGSVFFALWRRRPSERHLLHWAASNWLYAFVLIGLYSRAGQGLALGTALFALMGLSDILVVSGAQRLDSVTPFRRWMLLPLLAPAIGHLLPLLVGGGRAEISEAIGLAIAMGSCGIAVLREKGGFAVSRGRRIAGLALIGYVPGYLAAIVIRLWFPESISLLPRIPMLSDQLLLGVLNLGLLAIPNERAHERLRLAAARDPLTGLWNREGLARFGKRLLRPGGAVIAIDVDHFKTINDDHGHAAGDQVLIAVSRALTFVVEQRAGAVFRIGGDEFVAILPDCAAIDAKKISDRLRHYKDVTPGLPRWTLSVGIALIEQDAPEIEDAIRQADLALYQAKALGRDRTELVIA